MNTRVSISAGGQADLAALEVKALHGFHPPQFRLRVGDWRVRFHDYGDSIEILRVTHRKDAYK